jgi:hypothetical protein
VVNRESFAPTMEKMEQRFIAFARNYLGSEKTKKIVEIVKNLEAVKDLRELISML